MEGFGGLVDNLDFELDFNLDDFSLGETLIEGEEQKHILTPRINTDDISHNVAFENAKAFADQINMESHARTLAFVNGNFIFGDLIEALIIGKCDVKSLYIASLSMSVDNIDSLKNILDYTRIEHLTLILSAFFYTHEKGGMIPYLYEQLDDPRVQIAFGSYHMKAFSFDTHKGNCFTCHGSANLRSSNSVEQIETVVNDRERHEFIAETFDDIAARFGTINHATDSIFKFKDLKSHDSWEPFVRRSDK